MNRSRLKTNNIQLTDRMEEEDPEEGEAIGTKEEVRRRMMMKIKVKGEKNDQEREERNDYPCETTGQGKCGHV